MILSSRALRKLPIVMFAISAVVALVQTLAYLTSYDSPDTNYFKVGAPLPVIAGILAFAGCVFISLALRKTPDHLLEKRRLPARIALLPSAIGYLISSGMMAWFSLGTVATVTNIFLIFATFHQFISMFRSTDRAHPLLALFGFSNVFACMGMVAVFYFDASMEMNAPLKVTGIVGMLCVMLFSVCELRYQLQKPAPRIYLMVTGWLLVIGALTAIPVPIAYYAKVFPPLTVNGWRYNDNPEYFAGVALILGVWITAAIRFWLLLREPKPAVPHNKPGSVASSDAVSPDAGQNNTPGTAEKEDT